MRKILPLLIGLGLLPLVMLGQFSRYQVRSFNVESGLPDEFIYDVMEDRWGYLWVATAKGITRYSGENYRALEEERPLLEDGSDFPTHLAEGALDHKYAGYFSGKLAHFTTDTFHLIGDLEGNKIIGLLSSDSGVVALTQVGGLSFLTEDTVISFNPEGLDEVYSFQAQSFGGEVLIATSDGLARIALNDPNKVHWIHRGFSFTALAPGPHSGSFAALNDQGEWWVMDDLSGQNPKRLSNELLYDLIITDVLLLDTKEWAFATANKGVFFAFADTSSQLQLISPDVPEARQFGASCLWTDHHGNLWSGTKGKGLVQIIPGRQLVMSIEAGSDEVQVNAIAQINDTLAYAGTNNGLYKVLYNPPTRTYRIEQDSAFLFQEILTLDFQNNQLAVATLEGVVLTDPISRRWIQTFFLDDLPVDLGVGMNQLHTFIRSGSDQFVFAIQRKGIVIYQPSTQKAEHYHTAHGLLHNDIHQLFRDSQSRLWVVSRESGVAVMAKDGSFRNLNQEGLITTPVITDLTEDRFGSIWLATAGEGLFRLDKGLNPTQFTKDTGLYSNVCLSIICTEGNLITLSQNEGICQIRVEENGDLTWVKTDKKPGTQFAVASKGIAHQNRIWLGTESGLALLFSPHIWKNYQRPRFKLHLNYTKVLGEKGYKIGLLKPMPEQSWPLEHYAKNLQFSFESPDFHPESGVSYQYRLKGLSETWSEKGRATSASYSNLAPGKYEFQVQASSGEILSPVVAFPFTIELPFWEEWWYYLLEVSILASLVILALLSPKVIKSKRFVRLLAYIAIFMVFEYIHILLEPYIERDYVAAVPIFKVLAHLLLAIALFPLELILSRRLKKQRNQSEAANVQSS
ncbi:hypothetical protein KFE98_08285 [bacterium SCSIO 12741]|nr:hypothetical protein KFE98_08285 [bacterium SCSIO 12741]